MNIKILKPLKYCNVFGYFQAIFQMTYHLRMLNVKNSQTKVNGRAIKQWHKVLRVDTGRQLSPSLLVQQMRGNKNSLTKIFKTSDHKNCINVVQFYSKFASCHFTDCRKS